MFGKKTSKTIEPAVNVDVESMPTAFYGGVNPVVKFKNVEKTVVVGNGLSVADKKALDKSTAPGSKSNLHPANLLTSPKFLFSAVGILFVVFGLGGGLYYWFKLRAVPAVVVIPPIENIVETPIETVVEPIIIPEIVIVPTTTAEIKKFTADAIPVYPALTLGLSGDTDNDELSDLAEAVFKTDANTADTDQDTYPDGHEVFYLYNPSGKEPMKLIDSGSAKDFTNLVFQYKVYYPSDWAVGIIDENARDVLFSTITGEHVEIRAIEKESNQTFADWFSRYAPAEKIGDLKDFSTVFKDKGWMRSDGLVYYLETPRRVYVLIYHTTDSYIVNYKIVLTMMARSFRLPTSETEIFAPVVESSGPVTVVEEVVVGEIASTTTTTENLNVGL
ncbi:MAG: hypothetical protein Q7S24_01810 [bacterium]|nr:hypothetical protein [bacterium]